MKENMKKKLNDFLLAAAIGAMIAPIDYAVYGEIYENFDWMLEVNKIYNQI